MLTASSTFDARGTLGVDRSVDVGLAPATVTVVLDCEADDAQFDRLAASTESYCVAGQSLKFPPRITVCGAPPA